MTDADWYRYLTAFHGEKPGITERMLSQVAGSPYGWLVEPLRDTAGWIVDVACGSAPTRDHLAGRYWVGADVSAGELAVAVAAGRRPLVQARADALPFGDGAADAVCAAMSLQVVTPLTDVLAEIVRILRPGGILVAMVPSRLGMSPRGWLGWARVLRWLGAEGARTVVSLRDYRGGGAAVVGALPYSWPAPWGFVGTTLMKPGVSGRGVAAVRGSERGSRSPRTRSPDASCSLPAGLLAGSAVVVTVEVVRVAAGAVLGADYVGAVHVVTAVAGGVRSVLSPWG
ncbi:MAG: methyltransferase domain-containing protein [Pseudonocardiaceae bacterium]|nr:methyltransferase domain-containing protein [Pseudonocardiaceae bacterium]